MERPRKSIHVSFSRWILIPWNDFIIARRRGNCNTLSSKNFIAGYNSRLMFVHLKTKQNGCRHPASAQRAQFTPYMGSFYFISVFLAALLFVMPTAGGNVNSPALFIINNTIRLINASAPPSAKISFQRLRLATPIERTSLNIADDGIEPFQCLSILRLPVQILFPRTIFPKQPHQSTSINSCSEKCAFPISISRFNSSK